MSVSWCIQYGHVIQMNIIQNESRKEHFSMKRRVIKKSEKTGFTLQNMEDHFTFMEEHYKNHDLAAFFAFLGQWGF